MISGDPVPPFPRATIKFKFCQPPILVVFFFEKLCILSLTIETRGRVPQGPVPTGINSRLWVQAPAGPVPGKKGEGEKMAQVSSEKLLNELEEFVSAASTESSADEIVLPFEAFEDYSTDPVSFCDMSKLMLGKVDDVFDLAVKYNRRSSQYLKAVGKLEQGIKYLASCCVSKAGMQAMKYDTSKIGQLSTEKLYRMASYHFRKIDRGLTEYIEEHKGEIDYDLLDMQYRYFNLLNRLRATEVKIHRYEYKRCSENEDYDPVIHANAFSKDSWNRMYHQENTEPPAFRQARAFSALQSSESRVQSSDNDSADAISDLEQGLKEQGKRITDQEIHETCSLDCNMSESEQIPMAQNSENGEWECSKSKNQSSNLDGADALSDLKNETQKVENQNEMPMVGTPGYFNILQRAMLRSPIDSEHPEERSFTFTIEEMEQLTVDPQFLNDYPEMAAQIQNALNGYNSDPPGR